MDPIVQGVASNAIWNGITAGGRRLLGRQIRVTDPAPQSTFGDKQPFGDGYSYAVRGTLRHLPAGHQIWLLMEEESSGVIRPQGFAAVQYNPHTKVWEGRINGTGRKNVKIIAVVAPPTSQDYFRYYQKVGQLRNVFEPLNRVPPECRNQASVQARVP